MALSDLREEITHLKGVIEREQLFALNLSKKERKPYRNRIMKLNSQLDKMICDYRRNN
tara:strand:- start:1296 stop:1469 length:174 start_codon:yes stop_codon:yes gene_type:complete